MKSEVASKTLPQRIAARLSGWLAQLRQGVPDQARPPAASPSADPVSAEPVAAPGLVRSGVAAEPGAAGAEVAATPERSVAERDAWAVRTVNSTYRVALANGRYFVTKTAQHNQDPLLAAVARAGDSWIGRTLFLQVGLPMTLYDADGRGVVRTSTVLEIRP
jgi:hypothetical protein